VTLERTPAAALSVAEASKYYGKVQALQGVGLCVHAGEFVALLGPNGAGKSTLFQLLSGLFVPDAGQIRIEGRDLAEDGPRALAALGIVFQQPTLDLDLTVRANLMFHARLHGMGQRAPTRIQAELARVALADLAGTPCRALSGGNRRKVELARALLHEPRILLMDEATVGLDPGSRASLIEHVHALCRDRGLAVLWATHLVDEAEAAERVVVLHRGEVLRDGPPAEVAGGARNLGEAFLQLTGARGRAQTEPTITT
jgi:ABC-2 type transport system ATP-binding protein